MKNYFKKRIITTTLSNHMTMRNDLCFFTAKHLGTTLPHMRMLKKDTNITDSTLVSFASGKVNIIQKTKVFLVAKHNGKMLTDNTSTYSLQVERNNTLYLKTIRNNPLYRTNLPAKINKQQLRAYSTNNANKGPKSTQTWSEYLYPYFTSEYYYAGEIVVAATIIGTGIACYYYGPAVVAYFYNDGKGNPPSAPSSSSSSQISNVADLKTNPINQAATKDHTEIASAINNTAEVITQEFKNKIYARAKKYLKEYLELHASESQDEVLKWYTDCIELYKDKLDPTNFLPKNLEMYFNRDQNSSKFNGVVDWINDIASLGMGNGIKIDPEVKQRIITGLTNDKAKGILTDSMSAILDVYMYLL